MVERVKRDLSLKAKDSKINNRKKLSPKPNFSEKTVLTNTIKEAIYSQYEKDSKISKDMGIFDNNEHNDSLLDFDLKFSDKANDKNKLLLEISNSEKNKFDEKKDIENHEVDFSQDKNQELPNHADSELPASEKLTDLKIHTEPHKAKKKTTEKLPKKKTGKAESDLEPVRERALITEDLDLIKDLEINQKTLDLNDKSKELSFIKYNQEKVQRADEVINEDSNFSDKNPIEHLNRLEDGLLFENIKEEKKKKEDSSFLQGSGFNISNPANLKPNDSREKSPKTKQYKNPDDTFNQLMVLTSTTLEKQKDQLNISKELIEDSKIKESHSVPFRNLDKTPTFLDKSKVFSTHKEPNLSTSNQIFPFQSIFPHRGTSESPIPISENNLKKSIRPKSPESAVWVSGNEEVLKLRSKIKEYEKIIEQQSQIISEFQKTSSPKLSLFPKPLAQSSGKGIFSTPNPIDNDFWKINEEKITEQRLQDMSSLKDLWILNTDPAQNISSLKKNFGVKANALNKQDLNKSSKIRSKLLPKLPKNFK